MMLKKVETSYPLWFLGAFGHMNNFMGGKHFCSVCIISAVST